ncbi:pyridoxamine 5'-phosphate oxidase family protein [Arenibaculum pallidiluteum]|uniref:pyridoxamine 5'-phosphate oxidase family protein n=1 Tax=Arenibaculum pallidiluteum TaxID=2812559 RepID=UPI001A974252|nr:pyridoxamine 5'-phosphate oxidase family protein [Arenibaculum pallidiluteum]
MADEHLITDLAALERLYGTPGEASLRKETDRLTPGYRAMVESSPFLVLATNGPEGLDASPRGDQPGFVAVEDERTLLLPDRRGNERIDSLRNIVGDPRVALLFLIPGIGETLRVNGRAAISAAPALLQRFVVDGKAPRTVLVIRVEKVFFQCSRAVVRARLWDPAGHVERAAVPTPGRILAELAAGFDGEAYDRALPDRVRQTLY